MEEVKVIGFRNICNEAKYTAQQYFYGTTSATPRDAQKGCTYNEDPLILRIHVCPQ